MKRTLWAAAAAMILGAVLRPAQALAVHQDHTITLTEPVALINGVTLPAGTYLFTFSSLSQWQLNITTIRSVDRKTVYATLTTVPRQRTQRAGFEVVLVAPPRGNGPRLLKAWFCDGTNTGHEFTAPRRRV